jgi:hypothetical protein
MFQNAFAHSRTKRQLATAILLSLLFVVAAARQLIPGLCTTLLQVEANILPKTNGAVYADCCAHVPKDTNEESDASWNTIAKKIPPCPFCSLLAHPNTNSLIHTLQSNRIPDDANLNECPEEIRQAYLIQTQTRRGPPISI